MNTIDDFKARANNLLDLRGYSQISNPIPVFEGEMECPYERQYILRMMIRSPETHVFQIPEELKWLEKTIWNCAEFQFRNGLFNPFVYVTVRHGLVTSETDDDWHVDGFSMRIPHVPEQNYIWTNSNPTQYQDKTFPIPEDFDSLKHNLHNYLSSQAEESKTKTLKTNTVYLFDPYWVHRRPFCEAGTIRTFWRISFVPIEIKDDTCTQNPLLPKKVYGNQDIRQTLTEYESSTTYL